MKFLTGLFSALALMLLVANPAQAQSPHTFVSGSGSDTNDCLRATPCQTFTGAIAKTSVNGEITCLDTADFSVVTIVKSVTIDCHENSATNLYASTVGITIQFDNFVAPEETQRTVRLRNIALNGFTFGNGGIRITGAVAGTTVIIEDCVIDGNRGSTGRGIDDQRTGGGRLIVTNTTIRNNSGAGISVLPASGSSNIQVLLYNVRSYRNGTGAQFGNLTRVAIDQSAFTANTGAGVLTVTGAIVSVDRSMVSHNATGLQTSGGGTIAVANSNIQFNTAQGVKESGGSIFSFGNNRIGFNADLVTPLTKAGSASNDFGQQ
jgi:hypothetical protein